MKVGVVSVYVQPAGRLIVCGPARAFAAVTAMTSCVVVQFGLKTSAAASRAGSVTASAAAVATTIPSVPSAGRRARAACRPPPSTCRA